MPEPEQLPGTNPLDPSSRLRNPLPLTAAQEAQVRDIYHKKVRTLCADEIRDFAACARNRTVSLAWACSSQQLAMNSCMMGYATKQSEDEAREEWFAGVRERRRKAEEEKEQVEVRRREVIEITRRQEEKERIEEEAKRREVMQGKKEESEKKGWWR